MSLLQILSIAWGISEREVQRTLGRGMSGFVRRDRGHYRAVGPITAARLRRVRPLDPRLPVAVWISGGCTMWQAERLCSGPRIAEAIKRAAPHMREARVVLLALETRMARDYRATRPGYFTRRQETAVAFVDYRAKIKVELDEATFEPRFTELRNAVHRLKNAGAENPPRATIAAELGVPLRTFFHRYGRATLRRAIERVGYAPEAKTGTECLLDAMQRLAESGLEVSPHEVAEELGFGRAEALFETFTKTEYEDALAQYRETNADASVSKRPRISAKDTGQIGRRVSIKQSGREN